MIKRSLGEFDVIKIRVLFKMGMTKNNIAKIFDWNPKAIKAILLGKSWKRVKLDWKLNELMAVIAAHQNEWREVPSFKGILWAHPSGLIRTKKTILKPRIGEQGYYEIALNQIQAHKTVKVHKLIAETFHGVRPQGLVINHIDHNALNNRAENLEYVTQSQNVIHSVLAGRANCTRVGSENKKCKLEDNQVNEMLSLHSKGMSGLSLSKKFGICHTHACDIIKGRKRSNLFNKFHSVGGN